MEAFWKNVLEVTGIPAWGFVVAGVLIVSSVAWLFLRAYLGRRAMRLALERAGGSMRHGRIELGLLS